MFSWFVSSKKNKHLNNSSENAETLEDTDPLENQETGLKNQEDISESISSDSEQEQEQEQEQEIPTISNPNRHPPSLLNQIVQSANERFYRNIQKARIAKIQQELEFIKALRELERFEKNLEKFNQEETERRFLMEDAGLYSSIRDIENIARARELEEDIAIQKMESVFREVKKQSQTVQEVQEVQEVQLTQEEFANSSEQREQERIKKLMEQVEKLVIESENYARNMLEKSDEWDSESFEDDHLNLAREAENKKRKTVDNTENDGYASWRYWRTNPAFDPACFQEMKEPLLPNSSYDSQEVDGLQETDPLQEIIVERELTAEDMEQIAKQLEDWCKDSSSEDTDDEMPSLISISQDEYQYIPETRKVISENNSFGQKMEEIQTDKIQREHPEGYLEIYMGPMFSGKSTKAFFKLTSMADQRFNCLYVNSLKDQRETERYDDCLTTHNSSYSSPSPKITCLKVAHLADVDVDNFDYIAVDELQFFEDAEQYILDWVNMGKYVIVASLDGDCYRRKFGCVLNLIPHANEVTKLNAYCDICRDNNKILNRAPFTARMTSETTVELIGGKDLYKAMCRSCHDFHMDVTISYL